METEAINDLRNVSDVDKFRKKQGYVEAITVVLNELKNLNARTWGEVTDGIANQANHSSKPDTRFTEPESSEYAY